MSCVALFHQAGDTVNLILTSIILGLFSLASVSSLHQVYASFSLILIPRPVRRGDPISSYAAIGIALGVSGMHKPFYHTKVEGVIVILLLDKTRQMRKKDRSKDKLVCAERYILL